VARHDVAGEDDRQDDGPQWGSTADVATWRAGGRRIDAFVPARWLVERASWAAVQDASLSRLSRVFHTWSPWQRGRYTTG